VDLGLELERMRDFYEAAAAEAGVCLTVSCPEKLVGQLDRTLLQRALGNLVSNALRHTPATGRVTVSASRQDGCWQIEVADTGTGLAPQHLPRVFDRFYRADAARNPGKEGNMGLGLAIVKKIAELHGGSVAIASEVGVGTRVTISFAHVS
jgi:two-component system heavy metal sensor histidine kinase CusS